MAARWIDRILIPLFLFAAFVSLVYMPMFLLGCGWEGLAQGAQGACSQDWVGRAWLGYLAVEPFYAQAPLWLQQLNEFDTYFFGWFYLLSAAVFLRGRQERSWYRHLGTFMSGMMSYAMLFYLSWEFRTYRETGADIGAVLAYNGLWLLIFALLLLRLHVLRDVPRGSRVLNPA